MVPTLLFYQLSLVALVCVFLMLCGLWPNDAASPHQPIVPTKPSRRTRSKEPKPFAGLPQRPPCALCAREAIQAPEPPPAPPEPMPPTTRRPRIVDTSQHFCPHRCSGLQSKWVRTAINGNLGPDYMRLSIPSRQDSVQLRLQSRGPRPH
jgi:hypothetical protein